MSRESVCVRGVERGSRMSFQYSVRLKDTKTNSLCLFYSCRCRSSVCFNRSVCVCAISQIWRITDVITDKILLLELSVRLSFGQLLIAFCAINQPWCWELIHSQSTPPSPTVLIKCFGFSYADFFFLFIFLRYWEWAWRQMTQRRWRVLIGLGSDWPKDLV